MKLGEVYFSKLEIIRNFIILTALIILTLFLSGIKIGCYEPVNATCIDIETDYVRDNYRFNQGFMIDDSDVEVEHGIFQYEYNNRIYDWIDYTPFEAKVTIGMDKTILINPKNPMDATIINIPVLIISFIFVSVIGYGCIWSIISNSKYLEHNPKPNKRKEIYNYEVKEK